MRRCRSAWEEGLSLGSEYILGKCIETCQAKWERWNKTEFVHVGKKIADLQKRLEWIELQPSMSNIAQLMRDTRVELNCQLEKEDAMWFQRSGLTWFQEGDRNTRLFQTKAKQGTRKTVLKDCWIQMVCGIRKSIRLRRLWWITTKTFSPQVTRQISVNSLMQLS